MKIVFAVFLDRSMKVVFAAYLSMMVLYLIQAIGLLSVPIDCS